MKISMSKDIKYKFIVMVVAFIISLVFLVLSIINLSSFIIEKTADYQQVEATINKYEEVENASFSYYNLYYEYVAADGTTYTGLWTDRIANFDYVQSKIGSTIIIYVDNNLQKQRMDLDFRNDLLYVFPPLMLGFLATFVEALLTVLKAFKNKGQKSAIIEERVDKVNN